MQKLLLLSSLLFSVASFSNSIALREIETTLNHYINGTTYNYPDRIRQAFTADAELLLEKQGQDLWRVKALEYASWFEDKPNQFNGRIGEIIAIDITGRIATAKVEIIVPQKSKRYVDLFLLKKFDQGWKVTSKSAVAENSHHSGERILFIVSNAHFHGDSDLRAGVSFSEVVNAYEVFKKAGFTIDFVSPEGGAIPLSYINTSNPKHKAFIYDSDFMYAMKHSKTPQQIDPSRYRAVHYIGGSNAMYGVPENTQIQTITMAIYEQYNGIISSVCHGTAGIVNLTTKEGKYLVENRRISGYPKAFENLQREYIKQFPFFIDDKIQQHGGIFKRGQQSQPFIQVDGRIVTGQNYQSSSLVAETIVKMLQR